MRKSIGLKIFSIALIIIVLMAAVTCISAISLNDVSDEAIELAHYYVPIGQKVQWAARYSSSELLHFERLMSARQAGSSEAKQAAEAKAMRARGARVSAVIDEAIALVKAALNDKEVQVDPRTFAILERELPQIKSAHQMMEQTITKYLETSTGESGAQADTSRALLGDVIAAQRQRVSEEIADVSKLIDGLVSDSAQNALLLEKRAARLTWAVTIVAAIIGLGLAGYITRVLVRPVRQLLSGTEAVGKGNLDVQIRVTTADEMADLASSFNEMIVGLKQKETIRSTFGKYVDPRIVNQLLDAPAFAQEAERHNMTIFFSDLEGFTSLCEQLTPDMAVKFLNRYFNVMSGPIQEAQGVIDKYIGDSIMALWGPPFTGKTGHALLACRTALAQQDKMVEFRAEVPDLIGRRRGAPRVNMRVGIATGEVTFGNVGSDNMKGFTAIGDSVNLAARLESANKVYGTSILLAESAWNDAAGQIEGRSLDYIRVVGKQDPVRIFELGALKGGSDAATLAFYGAFDHALERYRAGEMGAARIAFQGCLDLRGDDQPSKLFLERIASIEQRGLPPDWDGVWTMTSK